MRRRESRNPIVNFLLKNVWYLIWAATGLFVGVLICNWHYFDIEKKISLHENFTILVSAAVAIYVGSNIQNAITRRQNEHTLLIDEVKRLLTFLETIEGWLDAKSFPFDQSKQFFKKGTTKIQSCKKLFTTYKVCEDKDFDNALAVFISMKQEILAKSPVNNLIILTQDEADEFERQFNEVRSDFLFLLLK